MQANAVSDKPLDLRKCSLKGADLHGITLSGGLFVESDMSGTNLIEAVFSKAYAVKANFSGALGPPRFLTPNCKFQWFIISAPPYPAYDILLRHSKLPSAEIECSKSVTKEGG